MVKFDAVYPIERFGEFIPEILVSEYQKTLTKAQNIAQALLEACGSYDQRISRTVGHFLAVGKIIPSFLDRDKWPSEDHIPEFFMMLARQDLETYKAAYHLSDDDAAKLFGLATSLADKITRAENREALVNDSQVQPIKEQMQALLPETLPAPHT